MALLGGLFGKKKELRSEDIATLFRTVSVLREPVIVQTPTFKFVTDIIGYGADLFHIKNTLSRDEVLYNVKGKTLKVNLPYELTMYSGESHLAGLGFVQGIHSLKLVIPETLVQVESRGAYRVSRFPEPPGVTFTTDNFDIIKARLTDISMSGAGLRLDPRWTRGNAKLALRLSLIVDIRLGKGLRISTTAAVRYLDGSKMGIQFQDLAKPVKDRLFKFVVQQRREEQRALIDIKRKVVEPSPPPKEEKAKIIAAEKVEEKPPGKPTALIVGTNDGPIDFLTTALMRKFDVVFCSPHITDLRQQLEQKPGLCLMELVCQDGEQVRNMRKASTLLPAGCVLMFYGNNFNSDFLTRFLSLGYPEDILIDLTENKKLIVFKQIQAYFSSRKPQ